MRRRRGGQRFYDGGYPGASSAAALKTQRDYQMNRYYRALARSKKKKPRVRVKKRESLVYKDVGQTQAKFSGYVVVTIALVFVCAMGIALSYAALYSKQMLIADLNAELKQNREQNAVLESDISKSYDLKEIERIATTKLGMSKPKAHQIIHIYVPKQSYVVQMEEEEPLPPAETPASLFKRIFANNGE